VKGLRIELAGERLDLLGIEQLRRAGEALADRKVLQIKALGGNQAS
jgi:hypothetical protein